ncbi:MAG: hypothetical protein L0H19_03460 [Salinisphaera sp.]|nr:hypothetical protein [Salinisphaera sp.]
MLQTRFFVTRWISAFAVAAALAASASAAPPAHVGKPGASDRVPPGLSKHAGNPGHAGRHRPRSDAQSTAEAIADVFFNEYRRDIIRDYYRGMFRSGHCPPGLAKKHNGCLPPGQAKKWRIGHRLPAGVLYHDLPHALAARLGYDDPGYRLIRVGGDILRVALATGVVVDALQNLGGLY